MPPPHGPPHGHPVPGPSEGGEEGHPWPGQEQQQGHSHGLHLPAPLERMKESAVHAVEGVKLRLHLGSGMGSAEERTGGRLIWGPGDGQAQAGLDAVPTAGLKQPRAHLPVRPAALASTPALVAYQALPPRLMLRHLPPQGRACTRPRRQRGATWQRWMATPECFAVASKQLGTPHACTYKHIASRPPASWMGQPVATPLAAPA